MRFSSWDHYRRRVVNPAGFRKASPGVWVRVEADGKETEFHPFEYKSSWGPTGMQRWQWYAQQGLGPDGEKLRTI